MKTKLREGDIPNAKAYAGPVKRLALALIARGEKREDAPGCPASVTLETSSLTTCGREGCRFLVSLCD